MHGDDELPTLARYIELFEGSSSLDLGGFVDDVESNVELPSITGDEGIRMNLDPRDTLIVDEAGRQSKRRSRISENREDHFSRMSGRFHDPQTGEFEPGGPPPDLDAEVDRYRGEDGKFKSRPADLYDEKREVRTESLLPEG